MSDYITSLYVDTFLKIIKCMCEMYIIMHFNAFVYDRYSHACTICKQITVHRLGNQSVVECIIITFHTQPPKIPSHKKLDIKALMGNPLQLLCV